MRAAPVLLAEVRYSQFALFPVGWAGLSRPRCRDHRVAAGFGGVGVAALVLVLVYQQRFPSHRAGLAVLTVARFMIGRTSPQTPHRRAGDQPARRDRRRLGVAVGCLAHRRVHYFRFDQVVRRAVQDVAQRDQGVHAQSLRHLGDRPVDLLAGLSVVT